MGEAPQVAADAEHEAAAPPVAPETEPQGHWPFIRTELCVYVSQIVMFFFVAVLTSNLLRNSQELIAYMNSKINNNSMYDLFATMLAIAATLGIVAAIQRIVRKSPLLESLAEQILAEAPRTIYVFGSSIAASLFAAAIFLHNNPEPKSPSPTFLVIIALAAALIAFVYGLLFAYAFKYKAELLQCACLTKKALIGSVRKPDQ